MTGVDGNGRDTAAARLACKRDQYRRYAAVSPDTTLTVREVLNDLDWIADGEGRP